ncbi:hypothetical protein H9Q13_12060 [Pontibacter sp. JH31]|uniref:YARHG domain-containing protein n=1 Tax=Pontibacter aquaedesilientis TaxID=2766980 RepID=A0ABR7XHZ4_9BACT|nr:hypothetical protein [Pontibacter aquaedesilientis]MBD1397902.1 hypothetical protein [Pontibacter aquaedesilientis]
MKKLTIILLTFTFALTALGQTYEPQILILTPNELKFDKSFEKDVKQKNKELSKRPENKEQADYLKSEEFKKQPENIQKITQSGMEFTEKLDLSKQASFIAHQYLAYRFYERFPNLLILLSNSKSSGNLTELKKIADTDKLQYILNFSSIELFKKDEISFAKISVQLYDNFSQTFLINSEYEGDWTNPGFEFACTDQSIDCTISNALSKALGDVIYQVASNSPTIKRDRELAQLRFEELVSKYYSNTSDKEFLKPIIPQPDSKILLKDQYQILLDTSQTKFVAFFIEQVSAQDFKAMKDNKRDKNVNIISSKDIKDEGFLDDIPQTYAYIVKGVKYNGKWFYEKSNVTYFEAQNLDEGKRKYFYNLTKWNFFKENTTEFNPDFWETSLFKKVKDLKQEPDWDEYGETIWKTQEKNDRPYIGQYEIVANQLKKEATEKAKNFDQNIIDDIIRPLSERIKMEGNYELVSLNQMSKDYLLIYPNDKSILLTPVKVKEKNGEMFLRYFVLIPNKDNYDIYEWNYLEPKKFKNIQMGPSFMDQINTLTTWNFAYKNLDDKEFWDKYVVVKSNGEYKYLKEIK